MNRSHLALFILFALLGCATTAQRQGPVVKVVYVRNNGQDLFRGTRTPENYKPVCSIGGKTYYRMVEAYHVGDVIKHDGACTVDDRIPQDPTLSPRIHAQLVELFAQDNSRAYGSTLVCFQDDDCLTHERCDESDRPFLNEGVCAPR